MTVDAGAAEHEREVDIQPENEERHDENDNRREARFEHSYHNDFSAVLFKSRKAEELAGAERDERESNIVQKVHALNDVLRHEIQYIRSEQDTGEYVCRDIRQPEPLCDASHRKARYQHQSHRNYDSRDGGGDVEGLVNVCLPFTLLEPVMDKLNTKFWFANMQEKDPKLYGDVIESTISRTKVPVKTLLGESKINVSDFINLQVGDIIKIDKKVDQELDVYVGNIKKFKALPGYFEDKYAVRITDVIREESE